MTDNPGTFRSINYTLAANVTITLLGIATGIMTARLLGPTGEGQYAAIQTWPLLLSTAAQLGLPEALVFYLSKNIDKSREYVITAQILAIVSSIIVFIVSWIILPFLLHSQGTSTVDAARIFMLISFIYSLIAIPHGALRGLQMFKVWNIFTEF